MPRLVASDVARTLRERIMSGDWADRRVPPERALAAELGVARNTVRRAMRLLSADGAITRHVGRGTFVVTAPPAGPDVDGTDDLAGTIARMEGASPADIMEIRLLLEPAAAAFAATDASIGDLAAVEAAHREAVAADDMPGFETWDAEFHHRIFACARNELLREFHALVRVLRNRAPWFDMKKRSFSETRRLAYCQEHGAILAALLDRDPEGARGAMHAHLKTVETNILRR
ncbi:FadR/GntR family transcriptional regulator [Acidisphaera rubrifaciens]|uniref:Transcriptional regulator GntR n=1 Tax=Acidisphaera rubrifaciens HS-AP3 TaxID=1231350 RepID=A0A0D6P6J1_9PROT|nr:FCD domain-containing protein [Acidisphaera rubrifaciens]GAN76813.1 transcriptional regulator GntR [Acidisphaera rubrifaciens HS-AP3]